MKPVCATFALTELGSFDARIIRHRDRRARRPLFWCQTVSIRVPSQSGRAVRTLSSFQYDGLGGPHLPSPLRQIGRPITKGYCDRLGGVRATDREAHQRPPTGTTLPICGKVESVFLK
jgi:hypothetical protein